MIPTLAAIFVFTAFNTYRAKHHLPVTTTNPRVCAFAELRLKEIMRDPHWDTHSDFTRRNDALLKLGEWYENLAEANKGITDPSWVMPAWNESADHQYNLRAPIKYSCVRHRGRFYVWEGWLPKK
jgi:hypothetical protein